MSSNVKRRECHVQVIHAASEATTAAAEVTVIRFGLLRLPQTAAPPATLVKRAIKLATTARNKLAHCFKWVLFARQERSDLTSKGAVKQKHIERFGWLDNAWLQKHVLASDPECKAAVERATAELLGKGALSWLIDAPCMNELPNGTATKSARFR